MVADASKFHALLIKKTTQIPVARKQAANERLLSYMIQSSCSEFNWTIKYILIHIYQSFFRKAATQLSALKKL